MGSPVEGRKEAEGGTKGGATGLGKGGGGEAPGGVTAGVTPVTGGSTGAAAGTPWYGNIGDGGMDAGMAGDGLPTWGSDSGGGANNVSGAVSGGV